MIFVLLTHHHVNGFGSVSFLTNLSLSFGCSRIAVVLTTQVHIYVLPASSQTFSCLLGLIPFPLVFHSQVSFLSCYRAPYFQGTTHALWQNSSHLGMGKGLRISLLFTYPYHHQFFFTFHIPIPVYACFPFPLGSYPPFPNTFILLFL